MSIIEQIDLDFKNSLKNKDKETLSVIRLLKSAIKNKEIDKKEKLNDQEVVEMVQKEVKKRKESETIYRKASREELANKESNEAKILSKYLPEQISDQELDEIINEEIINTGAKDKSDIGKVMSRVMVRVKGKSEGGKVSKRVSSLLG